MTTNYLHRIVLFSLLAVAAINLRAAEEEDLIATLQSNAAAPQKWAACQRLRVIGTPKAVPALAALLTDERGSQAARHALERLPFPEAGAALREALTQTSGLLKAGVIDSLGWRGEPASVPLLTPLLVDNEATIAAAAAGALGRIGGPESITALSTARDQERVAVARVAQESLLKCAERAWASNDSGAALAIYQGLTDQKYPVQVRIAAWRGTVLSDSDHRAEIVVKGLNSSDRPIQVSALKLVRELNDRPVIQSCLQQWAALTPEGQLAVLDAQVKLGAEAIPTARSAAQSSDVALRVAAWQALGELNDTESVPALAKAAARGEAAEREAARESLARLRGSGAQQALSAHLEKANTLEKAELLRAFGERGDRTAVNVLLQNAGADARPVRLAALESIRQLAPAEAITPLLEIAAKSKTDEQRDPVLKALYAVCEASPNKDQAARSIVEALGRFPARERRQVLPLLSELATPDALAAAQAASRDPDLELAKEAVEVLTQWPNAAPSTQLLDLARTSADPTLQTLALRGAIEVVGQETDPAKKLAILRQAFAAAQGLEEKKQALGQIGQVPTSEALNVALENFSAPGLANEAHLAAISIAEKLAASNPKLADQVAAKVLEHAQEGDLARRAWALRLKPSSGASFIRDWVVSGPYRQAGIVGAEAVFNVSFGPEQAGQKAEWKAAPPADHVNLGALFPGAENCAAYLRTRVLAPEECRGVLLMGSDDGIKAWLNGDVVHSHNVDRGEVADQDAAPIVLKKGANDLMVKVTQGGGGWSTSVRVIGSDGKAIPGLLIERPTN